MGRLLCLLLVSLLMPAHDAAAQQVKLRANLQVSTSDRFIGESVVRFKQEVEKESKGAIVIEIIDKAKAHHDDEVLAAVASGAVDIGIEGVDRIGDKVLAADFIDEPFLFNFPALRNAAVAPDSEIRQLIDVAIVAEMGVRVLWWESLGSAVVFSKGRDVTDPARMKGQRVGASSAILAEFAARCGAKAFQIALEKLPEALKAGEIDMILAEIDAPEQGRPHGGASHGRLSQAEGQSVLHGAISGVARVHPALNGGAVDGALLSPMLGQCQVCRRPAPALS